MANENEVTFHIVRERRPQFGCGWMVALEGAECVRYWDESLKEWVFFPSGTRFRAECRAKAARDETVERAMLHR